jgi:hypothetical protein
MEGGLFALAMPRGGGKTAKCRAREGHTCALGSLRPPPRSW